jgi:hypothetical protein
VPDDLAGLSDAPYLPKIYKMPLLKLHLFLLTLFYGTETSQRSIVIYVNNGHKITFSPSAACCLQDIKESSDAPKQITLPNLFKCFSSYMQNSDEYLQHPGIGTLGKKKKKKQRKPQPNPASVIILQKLPKQIGLAAVARQRSHCSILPGYMGSGAGSSAQSVCNHNNGREGKQDGSRFKVRSEVQVAVTLKLISSTVRDISLCSIT